ncbi:Mitochondrial zinc maintenance protein 1, mitochondrial [Conoideocrella luteorostrata]|uniref:Mitochondrial zinc maintenance protein 1, mitochondrial n=1 Tax=Conoideocrella luteorostrata TaxID=1105319 RepID=A0AAJ0CI97_9HYPO|nr:Mitochondrial zinc maintenance protein 1, mitochondrial [Conoideocrella luteorostrata]
MALAAYRNLMRAARIAFQGDAPVLAAAKQQIRHEFRQKSSMSSSDSATKEAIQHAQEVAKFLRANVVQGKKLDGEDNMYRLRIHEDTERGDNDTIKMAGQGTIGGEGCCGGGSR